MDNSYIAGFFDGEGCVSIKRTGGSGNYLQVVAQIINTDIDILKKFKEKFSGNIHVMYRTKPNHKTGYTWKVASKSAYEFLLAIYPYAIIKRDRIKLALEFQERIVNKNGLRDKCHLTNDERLLRLGLREQMLLLNKRGITA